MTANAGTDLADSHKQQQEQKFGGDGIAAPLRDPTFRRIWLASLASNLGSLILGVGVAWSMTQMTSSADKIALVQTALGLPVVLISVLAGAVADVHDRRVVALLSLGVALAGATVLAALSFFELLTPNLLLTLCFAVGCGTALMGPAWQAAVSEQVPARALPAAVALNGISYNLARSIGPAIGGIVVAAAGTAAAFTVNAVLCLPLIVALFLWNRITERSRLPPEELGRAIVSGVRYIANSPPIKVVLLRSTVIGVIGGAMIALMPIVARDLLHGGAQTYGLMFSAMGLGAVIGAANIAQIRRRISAETTIRACSTSMSAAIAVAAMSQDAWLTAAALVVAGAAWTTSWTVFNIGVQLSVPQWVVGRSLAAYHAASTGGIAVGSWGWGYLTDATGVKTALLVSAGAMLASILIGLWVRMPQIGTKIQEVHLLEDPVVRLPVAGGDGPLVVEIEYRVGQERTSDFCGVMQEVQEFRRRNGAYGWSVARDIADPELWIERYHCPTWHDYLRQRNRSTSAERAIEQQAIAFHTGAGKVRVRRMLERPLG